eukprot:TRINITY_DN7638_c1_g1_i1.p1 TRINITY_DN7638_c1_g1~~TRINITY_DN7638_c1_g1_i1.p1  ORF type:complete len:1027 (+),score=267.99 TRINITY_DN7638_c1_g1_i1:78-3083(+)
MSLSDSPGMKVSEVVALAKTDLTNGLSEEEAKKRLQKYGPNCFPEEPPTPLLQLVWGQFEDGMVRLLVVAAVVSLILAIFEDDEKEKVTAYIEPLVIVAILTANAVVGVYQELNADEALRALLKLSAPRAVVIRDGKQQNIDAADLTVGDVVLLSSGDQIPADIRVASVLSTTIRVDQANLTGECYSIVKHADPVATSQGQSEFYLNVLYSSTCVTYGKAVGVVIKTGLDTEFGAIVRGAQDTEEVKTPLQKKLDDFGHQLTIVISLICAFVWVVNIGNFTSKGTWLKGCIFFAKQGVALAVAALPEGLPAVVTTCLALGTRRMAKKHALVRKLPSVETLGCTTVICSDKTGTLTTNKMVVRKVCTLSDAGSMETHTVHGTSFNPVTTNKWNGEPVVTDKIIDGGSSSIAANQAAKDIMLVSSLCNEASLSYNKETQQVDKINEAMEAALCVLVEKAGHTDINSKLQAMNDPVARTLACNKHWASLYKKNGTLEFTRERKSMSVHVTSVANSKNMLLVKGAPDFLLERCTAVKTTSGKVVPLTQAAKDTILSTYSKLASGGDALRCLGLATKEVSAYASIPNKDDPAKFASIESGLTFSGFVGILDPPRAEVKSAIAECHDAHVRVIVITGDNKDTAEGICREIGLFEPGESTVGKSFTGQEFDKMSPEEQLVAVKSAKLFSRAVPEHKKTITDRLQECKFVCAMTGDGVNDALALKKADIGIAMGSGTEVAKKSSDMVLEDDDFSTIVHAIEEGRTIYNNTKQFIRYLISSNIGEVVCIFLTGILGMPEVLVPIQLLWVNLVTDGLPATALGFNPPEPNVMKRPPRSADEPIVSRGTLARFMAIGVYVGLATVGGFAGWCMYSPVGPQVTWDQLCGSEGHDWIENGEWNGLDKKVPMTVALSVLVVVEMFNALNALGDSSLLKVGPSSNPYLVGAIILSIALHLLILYTPFLATIFGVAPLTCWDWKLIIFLSAPIVFLDEFLKLFLIPRGNTRGKEKQE